MASAASPSPAGTKIQDYKQYIYPLAHTAS